MVKNILMAFKLICLSDIDYIIHKKHELNL
jgi:hypothetical protein